VVGWIREILVILAGSSRCHVGAIASFSFGSRHAYHRTPHRTVPQIPGPAALLFTLSLTLSTPPIHTIVHHNCVA